eukprot:scaffold119971_cov36-Cyclotella_meneghiniana.AAC.3
MGLFLRHEEAGEKLRDENVKLQLEQESKQFADEAFAAAVTQQDKDKAKADVKKSAKSIKQIKDAITAAEEEKSAAMATIFSTTGNFFLLPGRRQNPVGQNRPRTNRT